ncbi:hypothetical protein Hypma_008636 [Hypsizygus marmoreus]|uniref:F-box domain-containing protein n=1 Tax=Hypsizygus marmoreus TaxID=39966 RepID=A0A369JRQ5_HYPMA|nr:hypothetical protein Hypma_008636 [Hypsizygus marmoreus]
MHSPQESREPQRKRVCLRCPTSTQSSVPQKRTGKTGKLERMPSLPLDILFEIFGHLHPLDILHLAQSTREMRAFLMSRSSAFVWKQARSNVEALPDCPPGMSEPQYADLLFCPRCHYCGASKVRKVIWSTKTRACPACFKKHYVRAKDLGDNARFTELPQSLWKLAQITGNIIHCASYLPITSRDTRPKIISLDQLDALANQYIEIKDQALRAEKWLAEMQSDRDVWAEVVERMESWQGEDAERRSERNSVIRQRRFDAIVHTLSALGWKEEIEEMDLNSLRRHTLVNRTEDLTDRAWNRIMPRLVEFMENVRSNHREAIRLQNISVRRRIFSQYIDFCTFNYPVTAPVSELSVMEPFRSIIEDTPVSISLTMHSFPQPHFTHDVLQQWHNVKKQELVPIMKKSALVPRDIDTRHIDLATTFFCCNRHDFSEPIGQGKILAHPGAISRRKMQIEDSPYLTRLFDDFRQEFWNYRGDRVAFHEPAFLAARSILVSCGLNPESTSAREMDVLDPLMECASCTSSKDGRLVMTWRRGVVHAIDHISSNMQPSPTWVMMNSTDPDYVYASIRLHAEPASFRCDICYKSGNERFIMEHMKESHSFLQTMRVHRQPHVPVRAPILPGGHSGYLVCW